MGKRISLCTLLVFAVVGSFITLIGHTHSVRANVDPPNGSSINTGFPLPPGAIGELEQIIR